MTLDASKLASMNRLQGNVRVWVMHKSQVWILLLLSLILAWQLASVSWRVIAYFLVSEDVKSPVSLSVSDAGSISSRNNYIYLGGLHLFGVAQQGSAPISNVPVSAPETQLNLKLYGVFSDKDSKSGSAIVGTGNGKQKLYVVGDKITTGVWLAEVRADHILLKRGSGFEALKFPKKSTRGVNISRHQSLPRTRNLSSKKQRLLDNVRIVPVFAGSNRQLKGYRLLPKKNRASYNRLGLRPSDVVIEINGISLTNQREAMRVIGELVKADQVDVKLMRQGELKNLQLKLN